MSTDLFNLEESEVASSFLSGNKGGGADGLLRPRVEEGKNGKRELVIRFLPNFTKDMKLGPTAIEKHIHYANFPNNPKIRGYYDCQKDLGNACPLCNTYWVLKNDKNPEISGRSEKINRSSKYYSYVYVVEDKQVPENEGKIFIYPFGWKIYQKIKAQAEKSRNPIRVEDLINGADLYLLITKNDGGFAEYDASSFETPGPIEIDGLDIELTKSGKPTKETQEAIIKFLLDREHDLEDFMSKEWTPQQSENVQEIIALLTNSDYSEGSFVNETKSEPVKASSVFGDDEDEDVEDEDVEDEEISTTRSKVSKFFEDDE